MSYYNFPFHSQPTQYFLTGSRSHGSHTNKAEGKTMLNAVLSTLNVK